MVLNHTYNTPTVDQEMFALRQRVAELEGINRELQQQLVEDRQAEVERLNAGLEQRVAARLAELQQSQSLLHALIDNVPAAIAVKDLRGRLLLVNHYYTTLLNLPREQIIGKTEYELFPAGIVSAWRAVDEQVIGTGEPIQQEELAPLEDELHTYASLKFPLRDAQGHIYATGCISTDITARKQAEEHLYLAQWSLDNAVDGIEWIDEDARHLYANQSMCRMLGYTYDELLALDIPATDPSMTAQDWRNIWNQLKQHGSGTFEALQQRKDGSIFTAEVAATYLELHGKEYICAFTRDISERQDAEAERAALQQQIITAQQATLRELSTPLIPISDTVVIMPLIGTIDSTRAQQVLETLLEGIAQHQAAIAILDITGVQVVDTQVANALIRAAQAGKMLGTQVLLTGIHPRIAQTLVQLGIDLSGIITHGTLQSGIAYALSRTSADKNQR